MALDTKNVRDDIEKIIDDLRGEIDSTFDALIEPFDDLNGILESKFLKRFLVEYGKLKVRVVEKLEEQLSGLQADLEQHDNDIETAFEELVEEE